MNPVFQQIIINSVKSGKKGTSKEPLSDYGFAKNFMQFKKLLRRELINTLLICAGVTSAAFGLKSFLLPSGFIDGGITGVSLLITKITHIPLFILIPVLNVPFIILGLTQIGKNFVIKTCFAILLLSVFLGVFDYPVLTNDKLLISVFGGFFLGAGIGLAMRGGGVLDGTEVMAIYLGRKTSLTIGDIILVLNVIIFSFAAWLLSFEAALYSLLTYLAASKTVDYIVEGIEEYTGVTIISIRSETIRKMITEELGRGVTIYKGSRGYGKRTNHLSEIDILFSVITRLEVSRLKSEIERIDPDAFVIMNSLKEIKGGLIKKRSLA